MHPPCTAPELARIAAKCVICLKLRNHSSCLAGAVREEDVAPSLEIHVLEQLAEAAFRSQDMQPGR